MDKLKQITDSYKDYSEGQNEGVLFLLLALATLAAVVAIGYGVQRFLAARDRSSRRRTFRKFADASGLSEEETLFLLRLAERAELENLSRIFVERSLFEVGAPALDGDRDRVESIRQKVYGT